MAYLEIEYVLTVMWTFLEDLINQEKPKQIYLDFIKG